MAVSSFAQTEWSWRTPPSVQSVLYEDGVFVAVGDYGRIFVSHNAQSWKSVYSGTDRLFFDVTYQPGLWVAVATNGTVATSPDARTWTTRSTPIVDNFYKVCSGNGLFVGGSSNGNLVTSSDGVTWTVTFPSTSGPAIFGLAYGNGRFVAVQENSSSVLTSPDGQTWTKVLAPGLPSRNVRDLTFGHGIFVVVAEGGKIATSPDGLQWSLCASNTTSNLQSITFRNGCFAAAAANGQVLTSPDGITWTAHPTGSTQVLKLLEYGNGTWVAFQQADLTAPLRSRDLINWTAPPLPPAKILNGVTYGNGLYVCVGAQGTIRTSPDGLHWTARTSGIAKDLLAVTFGAGRFVATGSDAEILTSVDAITWTRLTTSISGFGGFDGRRVIYAGNRYAAIFQTSVMTSPDGLAWTRRIPGGLDSFSGVTWDGGKFLALTYKGEVRSSVDGTSWAVIRPAQAPSSFSNDLAYGNGILVIVGEYGRIWSSVDGSTWTLRTSDNAQSFSAVNFIGGYFVAVGRSGVLATSRDAITWTFRSSGWEHYGTLSAVTSHGSQFIVAGDYGVTITSSDLTGYPYAAWVQEYFPDDEPISSDTLSAAAPAHDGVANSMKYAFGFAPRDSVPTSELNPSLIAQDDGSGAHGALTFQRSRNAGPGLTFRLQYTASLAPASWQDVAASETVTATRSNRESVQLWDPAFLSLNPSFYRIAVDFGN